MTDGRSRIEILLVEDNPGDERLTREALKEGKVYHNLHWCKDGVEAIEVLTGAARPILDRWFESEQLKVTLATDAVIGAHEIAASGSGGTCSTRSKSRSSSFRT